MPKYFYTAQSLKRGGKTDVLEAKDIHQLAEKLRKQGFILIRAETEKERKTRKNKFNILLSFGGVSLTEKLFFTRNLAVMIAAGFPLPRALDTLSSQAKSEKLKKTLLDIKEEIIKGKNFSESLGKYPNIFSELFRNMIKVGEEAGNLEDVLKILAFQMEREHELSSKIKGAMIYPAVIICAMLGVGILMLVMVVPQLTKTFKQLDIELPATTRFVIGLGDFLVQKWYLVILIVIFLVLFFWRLLKIKKGKRFLDALLLKMPIISPIIKKSNSAATVRNLASLISSGVPIVRSLEIVSGTLGNIYYKEAIVEATKKVKKGEKLSEALKPYGNIYPLTVVQMIAVGEETGETSKILSQLADFFEEEVTRITQNLASVIEPVIMLIIGAAVGFFAISMVQPMYSMLQGI